MSNESVNITPDNSAVAEVPHDTQSEKPQTNTAPAGGRFELVGWAANLIVDKACMQTALTLRDSSGCIFRNVPCYINGGTVMLLQFDQATEIRGIDDHTQMVSVPDLNITPADARSIFEQLLDRTKQVFGEFAKAHCMLSSATSTEDLVDPKADSGIKFLEVEIKNDEE